MARWARMLAPGALALVAALVVAATAQANAFTDLLRDYRGDGRIDTCSHTEADLAQARSQIPKDIKQYAPDFPAALKAAIAARARGECTGQGTNTQPGTSTAPGGAAPGTTAPGTTAPGTTPTAPGQPGAGTVPKAATPPGAGTAPRRGGSVGVVSETIPVSVAESDPLSPAVIVVLAVLAGLLLLAGLLALVAYFMGWGPGPLKPAWDSVREASWRGEAAWFEFWDWVRLGR